MSRASLPERIVQREKIMAEFSALLAHRAPEQVRSLIFTGPASFREPEIDNLWHPYMAARGFLFFLSDQWMPMLRSFIGGVRRCILGRFGSSQYFPNPGASILAITPLDICTITSSGVQTIYCHPDDVPRMSWLVFNAAGKEAHGYGISRTSIFKMYVTLLWCWACVSVRSLTNPAWAMASIITLRWLVGLQWVTLWMLDRTVTALIQSHRPSHVFGVHEMFPWARVIWSVARRLQTPTITIQHASIVREKLWYFATETERRAGLVLPDVFVVFSEQDAQLMAPWYPTTTFVFGCGPRYAHWKDTLRRRMSFHGGLVLFVSSVPWWDTDTILRGLKRFIEGNNNAVVPILRLHPRCVVRRPWRQWIRRAVARGAIQLSTRSLAHDLQNASAVVGMNSTVLEEAIACGIPTIVLEPDQFLSFGTTLGSHWKLSVFDRSAIKPFSLLEVQFLHEQSMQARARLGIDQSVFCITNSGARLARNHTLL